MALLRSIGRTGSGRHRTPLESDQTIPITSTQDPLATPIALPPGKSPAPVPKRSDSLPGHAQTAITRHDGPISPWAHPPARPDRPDWWERAASPEQPVPPRAALALRTPPPRPLSSGSWFEFTSGPCVTALGSARFRPDHPSTNWPERWDARSPSLGMTVLTGSGGPGIMGGQPRGLKGGGRSVFCLSASPKTKPNAYLDRFVGFILFVRKVMLVKYSYAFVAPSPAASGPWTSSSRSPRWSRTARSELRRRAHRDRVLEALIDYLRGTFVASGTINRPIWTCCT